ncbi:hypothetical protein PMI11_01549, partial [Rhizobium sp. CF142]
MKQVVLSWQGLIALLCVTGAMVMLPVFGAGATQPPSAGTVILIALIAIVAALISFAPLSTSLVATALFIGAHGTAWLLLGTLSGNEGFAGTSFFLLLAACWLLAWRCVTELSELKPTTPASQWLV